MKKSLLAVAVGALLLVATLTLTTTTSRAQGIQLIVRGDDFGMTEGNLEAVEKAMNEGVMTCTSLIVPAPWFEAASELARRNPGWCAGIHLCLVGEWQGYRWRPVLPWDRVRSLVDSDGYFHASPQDLFAHEPKPEEMEAELRAQVGLARKKGVNIQYVDTHYIELSDHPAFGVAVRKIAQENDIPISSTLGERPMEGVYTTPVDQKLRRTLAILKDLDAGLWLWVCHVGIDSPEQRALIHTLPPDIFVDGGVGVHRAAELSVLTSLEVRSVIMQKGIKLTSYRELWKKRH